MPDLDPRLPAWFIGLFLAVHGAAAAAELLAELRHWIPIIFG
ncbi:hypothetical protein [Aureimonas sp. Leaf324]|nr:hypothetical protein [Aureimonas sp. Leaf324]